MTRSEAIASLSETYAKAFRLAEKGLAGEALSAQLGVPPEALPALFRLAEAKVSELQGNQSAAGHVGGRKQRKGVLDDGGHRFR